jgi:PleD family two-component response regulator
MTKTGHNQSIIAIVDDLFFSSKIRESAKTLRLDLEFIKDTNGLIQKLQYGKPSLIILDLNSKASSPLETIKKLKSSPDLKNITILGYISHVQTELKDEAIKAGCDLIFPRSKFSNELKEILMKYSMK